MPETSLTSMYSADGNVFLKIPCILASIGYIWDWLLSSEYEQTFFNPSRSFTLHSWVVFRLCNKYRLLTLRKSWYGLSTAGIFCVASLAIRPVWRSSYSHSHAEHLFICGGRKIFISSLNCKVEIAYGLKIHALCHLWSYKLCKTKMHYYA